MYRIALLIGMVISLVSAQIYFSENFEGSTTNWTVTGGGWQFGTPTVGPGGAFEGTRCAGTVLNGNYGNSVNYFLTSPSIKLPNVPLIKLSFYDWYSLESCCDYIYVDIETDSSGNWTTLLSKGGSSASWVLRELDLSQYANSTVRIRFRLTSDGSVVYSGWYIDQLNIYTPDYKTLTMQKSGNGTITPAADSITVERGVATQITATPNTGYRFNGWTVESGTATIASPTSQNTNVTLSTDATIRANFVPGTVHNITSSATTYNFTTHYFDVQASNGVRFSFTAPRAGNYSIVVSNTGTVGKYLYYYGTSSTFSSYINYTSGTSTITYNFSAASAGETHYFRVIPNSSSYYTSDFTINYTNAYTLTLTSGGNGTVSPTTAVLAAGQAQTITATADTGYRLDKWTTMSGNADISDSSAYSTTVSISSDATIRANFIPGTIYPLTSTAATYNFTTHYYDIRPQYGVRFRFIAPRAGNYSIVVSNTGSVEKYLYYFGTAGFSTSYITSVYGTSTITYNFSAAAAGETHYFRVSPYSSTYWTNNFTINYTDAYTLTVIPDGNGTVNPSSAIITAGQAQTITATPRVGHYFDSWTVQSGNATITNTTATSTTVSITGDATIKARFIRGTFYPVTLSPDTFNFTTHKYENNVSEGVILKFIAPAPGPYAITIDNAYKNLTYYGKDSTFASISGSTSNTSSKILYAFNATSSNESHYFLIKPYNSSYYTSNFTAQIITPVKLKILSDGNGSCFPSSSISIWNNADTAITAIPNGGYLFSSWSLISGNVQFSSTSSATTRVRVLNDSAVIQANFIINPATRPNIKISDINISSHPDICLTAVVTDSASRSISGLDTTNFSLMQDNSGVNYQLTQVSEVAGVSVALVIDRSGSMSTQMMTDAKNAALQYVRTMGPLDRSAIITFSDYAVVDRAITSDTSSLISAINSIVVQNMTALLDGTLEGLKQLSNETNTRAVIVFSDGLENYSKIATQSSVINFARQNNITIYSIGIGSSADKNVLKALADSTGGYFTAAPSAAQLAQIYAQIKSDIQSQYILCYRSPDEVFNGDTHQVVVSVNLNNHTDRDTVYWNENNRPPLISLTAATQAMIGVNQTPNQPLTISANVTDDGIIRSVRLFYRPSNLSSGAYTEIPMQNSSGTLYQATIPATSVKYPGVDFYILATDNYQLIGRSPNILAPETQPWVIPVGNNVPTISDIQAICLTQGIDNSISAKIEDDDGINLALLYYKKRSETFFTIDTMTVNSFNNYTGIIPSNVITSNGIDYYIRALDSAGATARYPSSGYDSLFICSGHLVITAPKDTSLSEGDTLNLIASASIPNAIISAINSPAWLTITANTNTYGIKLTPGCNDHGDYRIHLIAINFTDTAHAYFNVKVKDVNFPPVFDPLPFERKINEAVPYELVISVQDCDGEIPTIRMLTSVAGATFTDNRNSTGTFRWTPDADDYGYYMYIFEATDGVNAPVRDTILIEVIDQNVAKPVLKVSTVDTTSSINIPLVIVAHATDADGTVPVLKGIQLPKDAKFTTDNSGNAVFSWTPKETGTFTFKIIACDQVDSSSYDSQTVIIRINSNNITGPKFEPHPEVTIQQDEILILNLRATDPDGTIPILRLVSAPSGSRLIDNGNGTAMISWSPGCDVSGTFLFKATATDGKFSDEIEIPVRVRDVNCTPVFFKAEDVNVQAGERVNIQVRAYDPDNNGSIPTLSVNCMLPDYSFVTQNNGSAVFSWTASYTSGTYPVTFYATDGNSTDSMRVLISINKSGSLKITARPSGSKIYAFPSDCYKGKLIGVDSTIFSGAPGTCWFEFQAPGYRSQRVACNIKPDTTTTLSINLKPAIPLMVISPDTLKCGSSSQILHNGSISFADLNKDHIPDLSIATTYGIICYYGISSTDNSLFSSIADTIFSGALEPSLHHTFSYWNNNSNLSCILSTKTGKILRINLKTKITDTLISISGSRLYPTIFDADGDGKKDLIVVNAGKGLFVYKNTGSDSVPAIAFAKECTAPGGLSLSSLNGAALLLDTDMDGKEEVIAFSEGKLKLFKADSLFSTLTYIENLSCGGKLVTADSMSSSLIGSTRGVSSFAIRNGNQILVYPTHLQGDITFDGKVDIHDISKASRNWEMTSDNQSWDPTINVKLSETGIEKIDIRDVSRISKNWELQQ